MDKLQNYFLKMGIFPLWPKKHMNLALINRDGKPYGPRFSHLISSFFPLCKHAIKT